MIILIVSAVIIVIVFFHSLIYGDEIEAKKAKEAAGEAEAQKLRGVVFAGLPQRDPRYYELKEKVRSVGWDEAVRITEKYIQERLKERFLLNERNNKCL